MHAYYYFIAEFALFHGYSLQKLHDFKIIVLGLIVKSTR